MISVCFLHLREWKRSLFLSISNIRLFNKFDFSFNINFSLITFRFTPAIDLKFLLALHKYNMIQNQPKKSAMHVTRLTDTMFFFLPARFAYFYCFILNNKSLIIEANIWCLSCILRVFFFQYTIIQIGLFNKFCSDKTSLISKSFILLNEIFSTYNKYFLNPGLQPLTYFLNSKLDFFIEMKNFIFCCM